MRRILITNDDGINADGIIRLARAAQKFGEVWVVAPDGQRSAMSHRLTLDREIKVWEVDFPVAGVHAYACDAMPADCVRIGVLDLVPGKPDHVLSGINLGPNTATDLQYSATVSAAFEGAFQGIHSIALSEDFGDDHRVTDLYLEDILQELLDKPLDRIRIWNVNFPCCEPEDCKGILRGTKVSGGRLYTDSYVPRKLEDGVLFYHIETVRSSSDTEGTDLQAVLANYISVGIATNIQ